MENEVINNHVAALDFRTMQRQLAQAAKKWHFYLNPEQHLLLAQAQLAIADVCTGLLVSIVDDLIGGDLTE